MVLLFEPHGASCIYSYVSLSLLPWCCLAHLEWNLVSSHSHHVWIVGSVIILFCRGYQILCSYLVFLALLSWFIPFLSFPTPAGGHGVESGHTDKVRLFRAEKSYAVTQGKWYFEFEAVTAGEMRVGWARPSVRSDIELGTDELAFVFNGNKVRLPCPPVHKL